MGTATQRKAKTIQTAPETPAPAAPVAEATPADPAAEAEETLVPQIVMPGHEDQTFELLDGRKVTMGRPKGVYTLLVYKLLGKETSEELNAIYRGLFHVKAIDGEPVTMPTSQAEINAVAGLVGDYNLDQIGNLYLDHFAPRVEVIRPLSKTP